MHEWIKEHGRDISLRLTRTQTSVVSELLIRADTMHFGQGYVYCP